MPASAHCLQRSLKLHADASPPWRWAQARADCNTAQSHSPLRCRLQNHPGRQPERPFSDPRSVDRGPSGHWEHELRVGYPWNRAAQVTLQHKMILVNVPQPEVTVQRLAAWCCAHPSRHTHAPHLPATSAAVPRPPSPPPARHAIPPAPGPTGAHRCDPPAPARHRVQRQRRAATGRGPPHRGPPLLRRGPVEAGARALRTAVFALGAARRAQGPTGRWPATVVRCSSRRLPS